MSISDGFNVGNISGTSLNIQAFHGASHGVDGAVDFIGGAAPDAVNDAGGPVYGALEV